MSDSGADTPADNELKRKHSGSDSESAQDQHDDKRVTGSVPEQIIIDDDGDLYMKLDAGTLKVSRKALSLSSPVFLAMLGAKSQFAESSQKTLHPDGIQIISFDEDDFETMSIVARIIHLQSDKVPESLDFDQLHQIAMMCDQYDLKRCLGPWIKAWATPHLDSYRVEGYEGWLFASIVFQYDGLFKEITRYLILETRISPAGLLIINQDYDISQGVSEATIDKIKASRTDASRLILNLYFQEFLKLRSSNTKRVCNVWGVKQAMCDAVNLGCLVQGIPAAYLCDPRTSKTQYLASPNAIAASAGLILDGSSSIIYKFGDHRGCSVGPRLKTEAQEILDAVEGLELVKEC